MSPGGRARPGEADEAGERFARTVQLLGASAVGRLRRSAVCIAGLGAVGSFAAEALARAGLGRIRLADFDIIRPSNVNRQLHALGSTFGRPKVEAVAERILDIQPGCRVEPLRVFLDERTLPRFLEGPPDVVIDAIDSLSPKVFLLAAARRRGIYAVSCMGAATRLDPERIRVDDIARTRGCPLARFVRKRLRKLGMDNGVRCVYSTEPRRRVPAAVSPGWGEDDVERRGRPRAPLGSLPTVTGMFGLRAAHEAIRHLAGWEHPGTGEREDR